MLLTVTSIMQTMESDWEIITSLKSSTRTPFLLSSTTQPNGIIEELYSNSSRVLKYPNGRIDTENCWEKQQEEHPDGTRILRYQDTKETISLNGTISILQKKLIDDDPNHPKFSNIQATIYAVATTLNVNDPNYIPTPHTKLPTGSVVGSFMNNHYTGKDSNKILAQQIKIKTIAFPDGSFISEDDKNRILFERHKETCTLFNLLTLKKPKTWIAITQTPKTENPYEVTPRHAFWNEDTPLNNPIARIAKEKATKK